jgi:hypothetical protein
MFFEIDGKLYDAQFSYEVRRRFYDPDSFKIKTDKVGKSLSGRNLTSRNTGDDELYVETICTISLVTSPDRGKDRFKKVAEGKATQSRFDAFNKRLGRQIAFGRALSQTIVNDGRTTDDTKRRRIVAWDQYFRQVGDENKRNMLRQNIRPLRIKEEGVTVQR